MVPRSSINPVSFNITRLSEKVAEIYIIIARITPASDRLSPTQLLTAVMHSSRFRG